ncbi:glycosyltransferase family 1 protein [Ornithinimicrobium sp. Arc0846-15]|nr:glycosyltransferase family 1 protein [Ornithinimicrobium laminariae]
MSESTGSGPSDDRRSLLIITFSPLKSDARLLRQLRLLSPRYAVTTVGYGEAPDGDGIELAGHVRIPDSIVAWHKDRKQVIARRYQRAYDTAPVIKFLRAELTPGTWDLVLANDVETVPLAMTMGAQGVHADLHEYAPRQNEESWRWRLFIAPFNRWIVQRWVSKADSTSTVGAELAREYEREFGIKPDVVVNAAPYVDREPTPVGDPLRLVHSGLARRNRSLDVMIDAVRLAKRETTLDLYLMPNDPTYLAELKASAQDLPQVSFHEPVAPHELGDRLAQADLGIFVLPPLTFNYRFTLPNKFFDFVQARLGIIVGPSPEMAGLIELHGLGAVTEDFTAQSLAAALDGLSDEQVAGFKAASHAVAHELSAEEQIQGWAKAIDALDV